MTKMIVLGMLLLGVAGQMFAEASAPEIDSSSATMAITLLGGAMLVMRARR